MATANISNYDLFKENAMKGKKASLLRERLNLHQYILT